MGQKIYVPMLARGHKELGLGRKVTNINRFAREPNPTAAASRRPSSFRIALVRLSHFKIFPLPSLKHQLNFDALPAPPRRRQSLPAGSKPPLTIGECSLVQYGLVSRCHLASHASIGLCSSEPLGCAAKELPSPTARKGRRQDEQAARQPLTEAESSRQACLCACLRLIRSHAPATGSLEIGAL